MEKILNDYLSWNDFVVTFGDPDLGDEIIVTVDGPDGNNKLREGDTGIICEICGEGSNYDIGVNFGRDIEGHRCHGSCPNKFGFMLIKKWFMIRKRYDVAEGSIEMKDLSSFLGI